VPAQVNGITRVNEHKSAAGWIGASLLRKEDARHLFGRAMFIADVRVPGVQDVAFVRSSSANARVRRVSKPADGAARVFTWADIGPINVLEAGPELSSHRHSPYPPLADGRVRYVGQTIAACVMPTRAQAEDLAETVQIDLEELPAVVDVVAAMRPDSPRVFDEWPSNAYVSTSVVEGDPAILAAAPVRLHRRLRLNRQATVSMEGRGVLAFWDHRLDELVVYLSTQGGQVKRMALARMLGIPEHKMRVIAPDIGGGFGGKNRIMPEDVAVAALALKVKHPVRWIEDRREHLLASPHARDHTYDLTLCAERDGTLLGIEGDIYIDAGAYALWPTGAFQEASMASRNLTGPYRMRHLKLNAHTVASNKAPMGPYRGVARPGATFALERLVDEMARELHREPFALRRQNIVTAAELPYRTAAGMKLDTGDYVASLEIARDKIDLPAIRKRQTQGEPDGRKIGVGFAFYTEQSGHGIVEFAKRKFRVIPGYESANVRMLPDGSVIIYFD
jgi:carbon-monoxide dehydrogenase large subunit